MLEDLSDLRESLFAVRLLREQALVQPLRPDAAARLRREFLSANARGVVEQAVREATAIGRTPGFGRIDEALLRRLAAAAGGSSPRTGPGVPFQGRTAPPAARIPGLLAELLETLQSPVAVETWPAPVRAFAAHFLVRLVQPFEAPAAALGFAVEAAILAADGLAADRVLLAEPEVGADVPSSRPDPDQFVRARVHRLVERLSETHERLRVETACAALLGWADDRSSGLNVRERRLLRWIAEGAGTRSMEFRDYVRLHAGRRAPSLRSLQRDWKHLRDAGLLGEREGRLEVDPDALARDAARGAAPPAAP
jgi:hypothetical protein